MKKLLIGSALAIFAFAGRASAGTMFGALSNFDAVNDTGSPCNGFEIELDDIQSKDVTYTFQYQRYGVPKITEDTYLVSGVPHPRTFVRWMSPYNQVAHAFTQATPVAPLGFTDTGGHLCFKNMSVHGQPYDTAGCEHFGVGTLKNPSNTVYRWMKEDPATPGSLIAQGSPVTIPAPVWTVNPAPPNVPPVVVAVIPVPPPPAVVPVPYLPDAEFGVAVWAQVYETESPSQADLHHLVSDDIAVPGNHGPDPNPDTVTEIAWQILQTDKRNPSVNELSSSRQMGNGHVSVTRRYEFYQYVGPYDVNSVDGANTGTNEAMCASVGNDGVHGGAGTPTIYDTNGVGHVIDCSTTIVVGEYIGAQNAAADVATPLSANDADPLSLVDGEVGVHYPDRPLIFGGSGVFSIAFTGGTLPAADAGNEFLLNPLTGLLNGGVPNGTGTARFTVHATDLVEPGQPAVDATFNITVVAAVAVDDIVIPDGAPHVASSVDLTASGGESPFKWIAVSQSVGLLASVLGNTLSLTANSSGVFHVQVTVDDSLGGTSTKTLTFTVTGPGVPTSTPLPIATATATPMSVATATETPTATPTETPTETPTDTPTDTPAPTATATPMATLPSHDSVVLPVAPINVTIAKPKKGEPLPKTVKVKVKVRNADPSTEVAGDSIRLTAESVDCPAGVSVGTPDFLPSTPAADNAILVPGAKTKTATVPITVQAADFHTFNHKAPTRCTLRFTATTQFPVSDDPTPNNNVVTAELNVIDNNDPESGSPPLHESLLKSIRPLRLTVRHAWSPLVKHVHPVVLNADILPAPDAGDVIRVEVDSPGCPWITMASPDMDSATHQNQVTVKGGKSRTGSLKVQVLLQEVVTPNADSPARCTVVLRATGPSAPDPEPSNNQTTLTIDVIHGP